MYPEVFETQLSPEGASIFESLLDNTLPDILSTNDRSSIVGLSTIIVTEASIKVADSNTDRLSLWLCNKGVSPIYLAGTSAVTNGVTGYNFIGVQAGSNFELEHYTGEIWASAGASEQILGRADIG